MEEFMTPQEVAAILHLSPYSIRRWAKKGIIPACSAGPRMIRIEKASFERWLYEKRREPPYTPDERPSDIPEFLTVEDIAGHLKVSAQTVRRWINNGELPVYRMPRRLLVSMTDLDAWIKDTRK